MARVWRNRLLRVLAVVLAVVGLAVFPASPAFAACSGSGCNGVDPEAHCAQEGRADASANWIGGGPFSIILRTSNGPGCDGFWAKGTVSSCYSGQTPVSIRVERQEYFWTPYGYWWATTHRYYAGPIPCWSFMWTPMVGDYGTDRSQACMAYSYFWQPHEVPESYWSWCTDWVSSN